MKRFYENSKGVHLEGAHDDHLLCGDALEGDASERFASIIEPAVETTKRVVTCPDCIRVIEQCRGVRVANQS